MTDPHSQLNAMQRPTLLVRAARFGLCDYQRDRDLPKLTRTGSLPSPSRAFGLLISEELSLEETRRQGTATYSFTRHIEVLIALMGEARLLARPIPA